jgi:hypothetical protein
MTLRQEDTVKASKHAEQRFMHLSCELLYGSCISRIASLSELHCESESYHSYETRARRSESAKRLETKQLTGYEKQHTVSGLAKHSPLL